MMNDSVREELKDKIISAPRPIRQEARPKQSVTDTDFASRPTTFTPPPMMPQPAVPFTPPPVMPQPAVAFVPPPVMPQPAVPMSAASQSQPAAAAAVVTAVAATPAPVVGPMQSRGYTTEIMTKPTSPTLVEFQSKNAALPEWRIQLQNAVRQRSDRGAAVATSAVSAVSSAAEARPMMSLPTNGAAAMKSEPAPSAPAETSNGNPTLSKALQRIEESRRRFAAGETAPQPAAPAVAATAAPAQPAKAFPFYIATKNAELMPRAAEQQRRVAPPPATSIVEELPVIEKKPFDTNKLKPLPNAAIIAASLDKLSGELPQAEKKPQHFARMTEAVDDDEDFLEIVDTEMDEGYETEEDDEIAPLAMRFNSGIFDLLIGAFATLVLLSPLMIYGGTWFSVTGILAFVVTCAIVMFVYLTTAIGMFGKTVGMKIFALETIDIEELDYPTFHQAAVSSCVYIASLALGGVGFLPALFNAEKRTAPDLLSGTMVVREN